MKIFPPAFAPLRLGRLYIMMALAAPAAHATNDPDGPAVYAESTTLGGKIIVGTTRSGSTCKEYETGARDGQGPGLHSPARSADHDPDLLQGTANSAEGNLSTHHGFETGKIGTHGNGETSCARHG